MELEAKQLMNHKHLFNFKADLSKINIPQKLNNPFGSFVPDIVKIAAIEFQGFISWNPQTWETKLLDEKGKMFGVLVVQRKDRSYCYLGATSGKVPKDIEKVQQFVPTVFDDTTDNFFINRGMTELAQINLRIQSAISQKEVHELSESRKQKSVALQQKLFEHYRFLNILGIEQTVWEIFKNSVQGNPPTAAGECAAPKLLHFAFKNQLTPIAIAEFWWGKVPESNERLHGEFYPACKSRCRPILEFMLDDFNLYEEAKVT